MPINFLFPRNSFIYHKKSGGTYEVVITPDVGRLEATNTPAYGYRCIINNLVWFRERAEVEDGRFEALPAEATVEDFHIQPLYP